MKNTVPAEEAFLVTIGVPHLGRVAHCNRALKVLKQAGFLAGPTSDEAILEIAKQAELNRQLAENDPEGDDDQ